LEPKKATKHKLFRRKLKTDFEKQLQNYGAGRILSNQRTPIVGHNPYGKSQVRMAVKDAIYGHAYARISLGCLAASDNAGHK
jgi:hypothetical protein